MLKDAEKGIENEQGEKFIIELQKSKQQQR